MKTRQKGFLKLSLIVLILAMVISLVAVLGASYRNNQNKELPLVDIPLTDLAESYDGEIKDEQGNLLVPFDIAYPEAFASGNYAYEKDVLLLKLEESFNGEMNSNLASCGFDSIEKFLDTENGNWYRANLKENTDILVSIQKARSLSEVMVAEFNYTYQAEAIDYSDVIITPKSGEVTPDGASFDCSDDVKGNDKWRDQYYLGQNKVQDAWKFLDKNGSSAGGSSSVIVAVIDTGVDYNHPDLKANIWVNKGEIPNNNVDDDGNGYVDDVYGCSTIGSTYNHNGDPMDDHGHGTHVAGIIGASNNKEGIVGIAYNVKIMPIKAGQATGVFTQEDIAEAILYAYQMGADVINMSFGGSACSIAVQDALTTAYTTATLVASAGNDSMPNEGLFSLPNYPAALNYVIGVMSVDNKGTESSFTNYDVKAFNSIEYELYAPGEQMMSTLPDGRYGKLSGTSMAAPVVSAAAALLRSYYTDRDMYPSSFIAAQLCATSEDTATCCDPRAHGEHNLPNILNIVDALKDLPKPDIQVYDFYVFDPVSYNGVEYANNNGDGVADAGETLLIGLVLRNRWGMSKDTVVTVDALSNGNVANPYVEIIDGSVNFEGIGTYSTKSTLVYSEENIITGITDPIIIKLTDNCPNDYLIGLNVYLTYKNGLDENDNTTYTYGEAGSYEVSFWARNGLILPSQITEDMTLTKDNYYIIPNSCYIHAGVTVTVEPGTQIQFWSDDPDDPYASEYIAYLNVAGNFICQGTEEEPIKLFPSEMMSRYRVEIQQTGSAQVDLSYTTVVNPYISADNIDHCTFRYNFVGSLYYRYLSGGKVNSSSYRGYVRASQATNSLFYKCGSVDSYYTTYLDGKFDTCSFVDSYVDLYSHDPIFTNCVFMGNYTKDEYGNIGVSNFTMSNVLNPAVDKISRNPETGTTYIAISISGYGNHGYNLNDLNVIREIAKHWGGDIACLETEAEYNFVRNNFYNSTQYGIGIASCKDDKWVNGEPIGDFVKMNTEGSWTASIYYSYPIQFGNSISYYIIEIPGSIYLDYISLRDSNIKLDDETTYQISTNVVPTTFDKSQLVYVSEDENIATVSSTGLVTPKAEGSTRIFVYSPDYMTYAVLEVQIVEKVPVEDVSFDNMSFILEAGDSIELIPSFAPVNTTERGVTYSSTNTEIATVDDHGIITAHKVGNATIVATAYNGTTDEITIRVTSKVDYISFEHNFYVTKPTDTDDGWKPNILPTDATDYVINYTSSNPEVAYVDEDGKLVRLAEGMTRIRASIEGSILYDEIEIVVSNSTFSANDVVCMDGDAHTDWYNWTGSSLCYYPVLAVTDDGSLWIWGGPVKLPTKISDGVKSAVFGTLSIYDTSYRAEYITYVNNNGEIKELYLDWTLTGVTAREKTANYALNDVKFVYRYYSSYLFLTNSGSVYVIGNNDCGQLGVGGTTDLTTLVACGISDVKEILPFSSSTAFLTNSGDLYLAGTENNKYLVPTKIDSGVVDIRGGIYSCIYEKSDGTQYHLDYTYGTKYEINAKVEIQINTDSSDDWYSSSATYFENGKVYYRRQEVLGVSNPSKLFYISGGSYFVVTESGELYGFGNNRDYVLGDLTSVNRYDRAEKIFFGINLGSSAPVFNSSNVEEDKLTDETLVLDFDKALSIGDKYGYITLKNAAGVQLAYTKEIVLDKLYITPVIPFTSGAEYTVTVPVNALGDATISHFNELVEITFTYIDDRSIVFVETDLVDGKELTNGNLNAEFEYTYAIPGDAFADISLKLGETAVEGLEVSISNNVLTVSATNLAPGSYTLTLPAGALKDHIGGTSDELVYTLTVPAPEEEKYVALEVVYSSIGSKVENMATNPQWIVVMNKEFTLDAALITLVDADGNSVNFTAVVNGNNLIISAEGLNSNASYTLTVAQGAMKDEQNAVVDAISTTFTTVELGERFFWTNEGFSKEYSDFILTNGYNPRFMGNAILNNFNDTNVEHWLRVIAYSGTIDEKMGAGGNWWGTTDKEMIERQIVDFDDYQSLRDIIVGNYLTTAPENTFPFVTDAYLLNADGNRVARVSNETVTIVVEFNRDMDTSIPLRVRFGSAEPYAEYEVEGQYVNARRWEGVYTLKTTITNGRQFFRIENGAAADDFYLGLYETAGRFGFEVDTTAAQALTMLGEATETGIKLTWTQDDFETLAGYNVYRSTSKDGYYQRLNSYVIPADVKEFFDDTVEPGVRYYYNFTVVQTDLTESTPSGKIDIVSMDTMAPSIYHSPVHTAFTGSNLLISATVSDNLGIDTVILYYRTVGETEWKSVEMSALNSRYTGLVVADHLDLAGLEYYIEAKDGRNNTYKGTADEPYTVIVKLAVDDNALGDVDGDGTITNKDALMLLQAANDLLNLSDEEFLRADINKDGELSAQEALRILQYVSGKVTTIVD